MSSTAPALDLLRAGTTLGMRLLGLSRAPLMLAAPLIRPRPETGMPPVAVRSGGADVDIDPESLARAFPGATGRLVVLVPDGGADERVWDVDLDQVGGTYADRLAGLLDWTPVHLRVAGGGDPADVAVDFSAVLQRLVDAWPVEVGRIAFIGHGSGGLLVRAGCGVAGLGEGAWSGLVSDVIALGTPHLAVPAARFAPGPGRGLEERLAGITTVDRADPEVPALPEASYVVVTHRSRVEGSVVGSLLGNVLWWRQRLTLRPRRAHALFPEAEVHHLDVGGLSLANHPDVHAALMARLV